MFQKISETSYFFLKKGFKYLFYLNIYILVVVQINLHDKYIGGGNLERNEFLILSQLRQNARENLTKISRHTGIPVSTIFDKLRVYEKNIIQKHTSLLNFGKLGYDVWVQLIIKFKNDQKQDAEKFLMKNVMVNSFYKINNGFDFMVEVVFKNMHEYYLFNEKLETFGIQKKHEFFILQEMRRESFLNNSELAEVFNI
jgi:DNA-binding Lrp family transcriptional regulator